MNNNKIVVFWDDKGFDAELRQYTSLIICNNYNDFKALDDKTFKEAIGFLVLCDLPWDDESAVIPRSELGGVRLVQRFIRKKMNLRAPVVFASLYYDAKTICDMYPNYRIIKTPALKHFFKELPASPEELICLLGKNNNMTDTELAYTKLVYCDMKGLLVQMNHTLEGRDSNDQEKYRKDIEYIIQNQFNNDPDLMKEYRKANDLSAFCKFLLSRIDYPDDGIKDNGFLYELNHKTIRILYLEDELEKDCNVDRFVNYIKDLKRKAEKDRITPLFDITVEKNTDNIAYDIKHDKAAEEKKHGLVDFDVVISDIEIWNDKEELITLGFNVIETMANTYKRPLYYIVTNVSRSFYDQIKIPYVRRIRLKKEVFATTASIETFLYGIKEVYDHREEVAKEKETKAEVLFNKLYAFIKKDSKTFNTIENDVKVKSLELIKYFIGLFYMNNFTYKKGQDDPGDNFKVFNHNCEIMRNHILETMTLGNEKLGKIVAELEANNQELTKEVIECFVNKLILRRFFLYVRCFIDCWDLMSSFEHYIEKNGLNKSGKRVKIKREDIACRAINKQYKTLGKEPNNEKINDQSQCLINTLLFATISKPKNNNPKDKDAKEETLSRITDEETSFIKALNERSFSTNKHSKLVIDY